MRSPQTLDDLLGYAVDLAKDAGVIAMKHFRSASEPERKPDGSFVTAGDREAEAMLRERIREAFPQDAVIGEEFGETPGSSGRCWILDPIDGTYSFVHGVPFFGVLIGIEENGESIAGVAHFPATSQTIAAARSSGCFLDGVRTKTSSVSALGEALVVGNDPLDAVELVSKAKSYRGWGDAYAYMLVACGRADVAFDPVMNLWDCAALAPIVEEAGGSFTDWRGVRTTRGGNALATNGPLLKQALEALQDTLQQHI